MKPSIKRPDTPLAATPEPMPVSSGLQPNNQLGSMPTNKFQATADAAIRQISEMAAAKAASKAAQQEPQQQPQQQ
jgi:hypothetical protein